MKDCMDTKWASYLQHIKSSNGWNYMENYGFLKIFQLLTFLDVIYFPQIFGPFQMFIGYYGSLEINCQSKISPFPCKKM